MRRRSFLSLIAAGATAPVLSKVSEASSKLLNVDFDPDRVLVMEPLNWSPAGNWVVRRLILGLSAEIVTLPGEVVVVERPVMRAMQPDRILLSEAESWTMLEADAKGAPQFDREVPGMLFHPTSDVNVSFARLEENDWVTFVARNDSDAPRMLSAALLGDSKVSLVNNTDDDIEFTGMLYGTLKTS